MELKWFYIKVQKNTFFNRNIIKIYKLIKLKGGKNESKENYF